MSTLTVVPEGVCVRMLDDETILQALQRRGYAYRTGCRRGGCGVCRVRLLVGDIDYPRGLSDGVLTDEDRAAGLAITCRGVPRGDVTIALIDDSLTVIAPLLAALPEPPTSPRDPD